MVKLTAAAAAEARRAIDEYGAYDGLGLRVGVRGGGCSGFQYHLAIDEMTDGDVHFETQGVDVYVSPEMLRYVDDAVIDWVESLMGQGFEVQNPNAVASCGCGSSFRVADEAPSCGAEI